MGPHCLLQRRLMGRYVREMQLMLTSMANIPVQTNIWDQDQTAPMRSGSILIASKTSFNNELVDDIWVVMKGKCNLCLRQLLILSVQTNIVDLDQSSLIRSHTVCYKDWTEII